MRKNYFLPQTEIILHISVMECMQNTQISGQYPVNTGNESESTI